MPDTLSTITDFIIKPSVPFAAGVVLFGTVWGFFKGVESVLTDDTKLEIAVWLLDRKKLSPRFQGWPDTFGKVFDRVFGKKHLSWRCFLRSAIVSCITLVLGVLFFYSPVSYVKMLADRRVYVLLGYTALGAIVVNVVPDYLSLLKTRFLIGRISTLPWLPTFGILFIDALGTIVALYLGYAFGLDYINSPSVAHNSPKWLLEGTWIAMYMIVTGGSQPLIVPAVFTSIWLWLYAGA